ncbi:MAG TPA: VC0807 family protein [Pseudonocardia sp.]|nr:VC0807 family protein [Pseudonocardia sp.]
MTAALDTSATPDQPVAGTDSAVGSGRARPIVGSLPRKLIMSMAWDLGPSVAAYYGARALGCSEYLSLLAGTVASAVRLGWVAVRDRRIDPFALFLMVVFGVGFVLTFVTGDARFMLVKDSLTSFLAGLFFLGSVAMRRPITYYAAQRFAGKAAQDEMRTQYATDPTFRRRFSVSALVWGGGLTLESLLRIPMVFLLPIDTAVGASNVLMVVAYSVLIGWTVRSSKRAVAASA